MCVRVCVWGGGGGVDSPSYIVSRSPPPSIYLMACRADKGFPKTGPPGPFSATFLAVFGPPGRLSAEWPLPNHVPLER